MGGALLSGGLRSFGLLHCGIRSRRHCGARMAAPGTAIVENERDGQHWGRHLPHGVTVAQLLGSNLESGDRAGSGGVLVGLYSVSKNEKK